MTFGDLGTLAGSMRPPFLLLTPACVLLGVGTAVQSSGQVSVTQIVLVFVGALAAHISVNAFNEYFDYRSGLDALTERTPFSGGSGTLPARPELAGKVLGMALLAFVITAVVGLYFIYLRGWSLLPLGLSGLLVIAAYTPWITRQPLLCLIAPGLAFGPLMVMGTDFVLTGYYSRAALVVSLVPFFLVNNLLLLNQFPDVEADRCVGRKHLPLLIGRRASSYLFGLFLLLAYVALVIGVMSGDLPRYSLLGLVTALFALSAFLGVRRHADDIERLLPYMGLNVAINILTPVLIGVGLFAAAGGIL